MKSNKEAVKNEDEKKERNRTSYSELPEDEESTPSKSAKKEVKSGKEIKESWVFRKNKTSKEKNDPERFSGDGVNFKAKIIGIEVVFDARGNRMCQETLHKLKAAVKTSGEHKQRILLNISLMGIRIKDEKSGEILHHHPVHKISFISQDVSDNRAFGYVYGCPQTGHQFFGIKTEKTASQVVRTLRDLFLTALELKIKEVEKAMELQKEEEDPENGSHQHVNGQSEIQENGCSESTTDVTENKNEKVEDHVYLEWSPEHGNNSELVAPLSSNHESASGVGCVVDNLLDLQFEMDSLQQGITQMDYTIASAASHGFGVSEDDNSISSGCSFPMTPRKLNRVSSVYHETLSISSRSSSTSDYAAYTQDHSIDNFGAFKNEAFNAASNITPPPVPENAAPNTVEDKYAVFYEIDNLTSIFDNPTFSNSSTSMEVNMSSENSIDKSDENESSTNLNDSFTDEGKAVPAVFAELDPLGNQPFVDKENFFHELKNPPKKVLKDLVGDNCDNQNSLFESGHNLHLNRVEDSGISQEKKHNPFACVPASPPKLPPKRSFSISSPLPTPVIKTLENTSLVDDGSVWTVKNPFNPFVYDVEFPDIPPPNSPPPPPPPRLPVKDSEPPPVSPPPRPPSRTSAVPTPPRPRRKVPFGTTNSAWFSFDQEALSAASTSAQPSWDNMPLSPPLPLPLRKLPSASKYESPMHKSCSASNSPAASRRITAFGTNVENGHILNGAVSPGRKMLSRHSSIAQETWSEPKSDSPSVKNPFSEVSLASEANGSDCAEVNQILNHSPPLPPKSTGISRPRPSPSRKMLSAPSSSSRSSSNSSSSISSRVDSLSSSMKYSSLDESHSNVGSGSEMLCPNSSSNRTGDTHSSSCNSEMSGISSENGIEEKLSPTSPDSIFRRKSDPFADDFFLSLPKKSSVSSSLTNSTAEECCSNGFAANFNSAEIATSSHMDVFKVDST